MVETDIKAVGVDPSKFVYTVGRISLEVVENYKEII